MEQTLHALGGLMLKAIPTVFLLLLLYWYFRVMLFGPLEKVLKQRDDLTEGARKAAAESLITAERKQKEYEQKFSEARAEVYKAQEETRRKWLEDHAAQIDEARKRSEQTVHTAKQQINAETADVRQNLEGSTGALADEIVTTILSRKSGNRS
jgi:F-type H+-transporting ATPase subunit b